MVTNAEDPEAPPTRTDRAEAVARNAIAGHPRGSIRRIVLYTAMFLSLGLFVWVPQAVVIAIVCGILLLATDALL